MKVQVPFTCFECNELVPAGGKALHVCGRPAAEQPPAGFVKADQAKARMDLLPPKVLEGVAQVLTFGAKKYAAWNWVKAPAYGRYFSAAQRHLAAWQAGEDLDPETGLPHLHHALCGLMFLAELQRLGVAEDDRPTDARLRGEHAPAAAPDHWMKGDPRKCALCGNDGDWHAQGNNNISKCRGYSPPEPPTPAEVLAVTEGLPEGGVTAMLAAAEGLAWGEIWCEECHAAGAWIEEGVRVTCPVCHGSRKVAAPRCARCRYPVAPSAATCESCGRDARDARPPQTR